jgi:DNA-binding Lrp family transcriptional regulator
MSDFAARLQVERTELADRVEKLEKFILSDRFDALPNVDRTDLKDQRSHMRGYLAVLDRRVSRLCN